MPTIRNLEEPSVICPHCKGRNLSRVRSHIWECSHCESIYRHVSASSDLERLNVEPINDHSSYPTVIIESTAPYCDCKMQQYLENPAIMHIGPHYCPRHNVIIVEGIFELNDLETIAEATVYIINHETLHWILYKYFGESVSLSLDEAHPIAPLV